MQQYRELIADILLNGVKSQDRTGTGTLSVFGRTLRFNLQHGFPLVTLKKTFWKGILIELLWMLRGETNIKFLKDRGVNIWDQWADANGELGPVYGSQLRNSGGVDQLKDVIHQIKTNPNSRRILWTLWNPGELSKQALPPCHGLVVQFYVRDNTLSCYVYQRSADVFLGLPFDIASYATLVHLIANECELAVGELIYALGDAHLYLNHLDQAKECLNRTPLDMPELEINIPAPTLLLYIEYCDRYGWPMIQEHIKLKNYVFHPAIKAAVSI